MPPEALFEYRPESAEGPAGFICKFKWLYLYGVPLFYFGTYRVKKNHNMHLAPKNFV